MIDPTKQQPPSELDKIPEQYHQYSRVFSEEASHKFPLIRKNQLFLLHLITSYSSYFEGKKGISGNKTSFFLLMLSQIWDHIIELKPGAPISLPRKLIPLLQLELGELRKFVKEHLVRGTI